MVVLEFEFAVLKAESLNLAIRLALLWTHATLLHRHGTSHRTSLLMPHNIDVRKYNLNRGAQPPRRPHKREDCKPGTRVQPAALAACAHYSKQALLPTSPS